MWRVEVVNRGGSGRTKSIGRGWWVKFRPTPTGLPPPPRGQPLAHGRGDLRLRVDPTLNSRMAHPRRPLAPVPAAPPRSSGRPNPRERITEFRASRPAFRGQRRNARVSHGRRGGDRHGRRRRWRWYGLKRPWTFYASSLLKLLDEFRDPFDHVSRAGLPLYAGPPRDQGLHGARTSPTFNPSGPSSLRGPVI